MAKPAGPTVVFAQRTPNDEADFNRTAMHLAQAIEKVCVKERIPRTTLASVLADFLLINVVSIQVPKEQFMNAMSEAFDETVEEAKIRNAN